MRRTAREVSIGGITIGGDHRIAIQSMLTTDSADKHATAQQLIKLQEAGCDIARLAINSTQAAENLPYYKSITTMPLVADIHFDYRLALSAIDFGADKIRINPGNIGSDERIKKICDACSERGIPIRVGVNGGSLEKDILKKYGKPTTQAITESALGSAARLEKQGFENIVISIKSSDVRAMIAANRLLATQCDYPLHIGVTETGLPYAGTIKSAIGIGSLLYDGIGDTIRVSLTGDPVAEVVAANEILKALDLKGGIKLICCPTCGRTKINLVEQAQKLENALKAFKTDKNIKVALMGCVVNGPGEAREATIGVAGGDGEALLFKHGEVQYKLTEEQILPTLIEEIGKLL